LFLALKELARSESGAPSAFAVGSRLFLRMESLAHAWKLGCLIWVELL